MRTCVSCGDSLEDCKDIDARLCETCKPVIARLKKRGLRRHNEHRVFKNRVKIFPDWVRNYKLKDTGTPCSCMMCRNPRRTPRKEITQQEKISNLNFKEQMEEQE